MTDNIKRIISLSDVRAKNICGPTVCKDLKQTSPSAAPFVWQPVQITIQKLGFPKHYYEGNFVCPRDENPSVCQQCPQMENWERKLVRDGNYKQTAKICHGGINYNTKRPDRLMSSFLICTKFCDADGFISVLKNIHDDKILNRLIKHVTYHRLVDPLIFDNPTLIPYKKYVVQNTNKKQNHR